MQDFAKKVMLKKRIKKEKMLSDQLNKSVDIPQKFIPLRRNNFQKKMLQKKCLLKIL